MGKKQSDSFLVAFKLFFTSMSLDGSPGCEAISNGKVHLLLVPIENTLGGTIHANCDLQLQHNLFIIVSCSSWIQLPVS